MGSAIYSLGMTSKYGLGDLPDLTSYQMVEVRYAKYNQNHLTIKNLFKSCKFILFCMLLKYIYLLRQLLINTS